MTSTLLKKIEKCKSDIAEIDQAIEDKQAELKQLRTENARLLESQILKKRKPTHTFPRPKGQYGIFLPGSVPWTLPPIPQNGSV